MLLTRKLASGEEYTFSLAGRAPLAAVDTLVFYACDPADGESCQDGSAAYKAAVAAAAATDADCRSASGDDSSDGGGDKSDGGAGSTGCALAGGDGGVVPATAGPPPADGWEVADIAGGAGLVWRPNDAAGSPSEAGTGRRDYTWTVPADGGTFRLVLRAAGVQPWKHHEYVFTVFIVFFCAWQVCGGRALAVRAVLLTLWMSGVRVAAFLERGGGRPRKFQAGEQCPARCASLDGDEHCADRRGRFCLPAPSFLFCSCFAVVWSSPARH